LFRTAHGNHEASGCYMTDACLVVRGLAHADSCYELCLIELFRNEYIAKLPGGEDILGDYEEKASRIARAIRVETDAWHVYLELYDGHLTTIVALIVNGRWEEAYGAYRAMCEDMESRYLRKDDTFAKKR
jgi:hypothetical protein